MEEQKHITVFRNEAVDALRLSPDSTVVDATVGSGGHTQHITSKLDERGLFIGLDADKTALDALSKLETKATVYLEVANFRNIDAVLKKLEIDGVDGILADLGWRIEQFSGGGKGFSFNDDEPLRMTYGDPGSYPFTAEDIVNDWHEEDLENVLKGYGEERSYKKIVRTIVEGREKKRISTSKELGELIEKAMGRRGKIHPATKTFQALRIAVNDELDALSELIQKGFIALKSGGRMAIITFHSLEDRIVKQAFRAYEKEMCAQILTKKPIVPSREEQKENRRARSAKLRILEKL